MKKRGNRRAGYTLVELIVSFALIGIFLVAASTVIGSFLRIQARVSAQADAQTLSDTLLNTISEPLVSMRYNEDKWSIEEGSIQFQDKEGRIVKIRAEDGSWQIDDGKMSEELTQYFEELSVNEDVRLLSKQTDEAMDAAMEQDEALKERVEFMKQGASYMQEESEPAASNP